MPGKFEIRKSSDAQVYFNLKAANGQVILTSETYKTKSSANGGIASVKENAPLDARYERRNPSPGRYHFALRARNGEIIGQSELYTSASGMENGIESVKKNAPDAMIEDLTS